MEGLLSLPRSAKGGLAVLLAVALLGWTIVAYSAKRQHDDARSLDNAIATLKSQEDGEKQALAELESAQERLAAAESELASSRDAVATALQEKSEIETRLADIETELATARAQAADALGEADSGDGSGQSAQVNVDTLRGRLTETMTALSAKNATLQQRERALADAEATAESAAAEIEALKAAATERDRLRARLTETMTMLSAKNATLQQRERELARLKAEYDGAKASIDEMEANGADQEAAGQSLDVLNAKLATTKQALEQNQQEIEAAEAELARLAAAREESDAESGSLTAEIDSLQAALSEKEDAIADAEGELERLRGEIARAEEQLAEKQDTLTARDAELQGAEAQSVDLKTAIDRQEAVLRDLAAAKGELEQTKVQLAHQTQLLDARQSEVAAADARLTELREASIEESGIKQSLPRVAIADLSQDNLAVLPIDPMQSPMPVQTKRGIRLTLVHFDLGSADLTPGAVRRAREAAAWIKQRGGDDKIRLIGSTDTLGTKANNMALAERRAQSLLDVFAGEGIDPDRIEMIPMGEEGGSETIGDQTSEPLNRCVGIFIGEG